VKSDCSEIELNLGYILSNKNLNYYTQRLLKIKRDPGILGLKIKTIIIGNKLTA